MAIPTQRWQMTEAKDLFDSVWRGESTIRAKGRANPAATTAEDATLDDEKRFAKTLGF